MAKRSYGTGQLYVKQGAYSAAGAPRTVVASTAARRRAGARHGQRAHAQRGRAGVPQDARGGGGHPQPKVARRVTVADAADSLRRKLAMEGARKSYLEGCESMQRVHIVPGLERRARAAVDRQRCRSAGREDAQGRQEPEDGPQRAHVPAQRLRARDRQRLVRREPRPPCEPAPPAARRRRRARPAVPHARPSSRP